MKLKKATRNWAFDFAKNLIFPIGPLLRYTNVSRRCVDNLLEGAQVNFCAGPAENVVKQFFSGKACNCGGRMHFYKRHIYSVSSNPLDLN